MSNSLITLAIFTALSGGAFAAAFLSDPCASPCGNTAATVSTTEVWSGGSDTGSCIPETGRRRPIGACSETECSINEVAYKDDDNGKVTDDLPCEPKKPVIVPWDSTTSVAIMAQDDDRDGRSGCTPVHNSPPPPEFSLACYSDGQGDEPRPSWGKSDHDERYYPWNDRCYDISGDLVDPGYVGPCFDRWGSFIDVQTPFDGLNCT